MKNVVETEALNLFVGIKINSLMRIARPTSLKYV